MRKEMVTLFLQTSDRTRKAQVTVPRSLRVRDIIKASSGRWRLSARVDYQVYNMSRTVQLNPQDYLTPDKVSDGDTLMLQAFPTHGGL